MTGVFQAADKQISRRYGFFFLLTLFFLACLCGGLWGNRGSGSFSIMGFNFIAGKFILIYASIWLILLLLFFHLPFQEFRRKNIFALMLIAIAARGLMFFQLPSDDVYRYLWEGMLYTKGINPYLLPPADASLSGFAQTFPWHHLINHPDISAAYPPMMTGLFAIISTLSTSLFPIKVVVVLFDLGAVFLLILILNHRHSDIRWCLLYALNPLVLYSFAGEGHFDAIQTFFLLGAVCFYDRKKWPLMFLFAGAAFQVKYVAVIGLPFLINRENMKWLPLFLIPAILPFLPFIADDPLAVFNGLRRFESEFAFNGSIHSLLRLLTGKMSTATIICRVMFIMLICFGIYRFNNLIRWQKKKEATDPVIGIFYAFAVLTLVSPTIHLWYLSWVLPFAVIRYRISWVVLSLTAGMYFTAKSNAWFGGEWAMPVWAQLIEWGVFYCFFGFELWYLLINRGKPEERATDSVGVIIPVLNEEKNIAACIRSIRKDPAVTEIIVVDGASKDGTVAAAESEGATVLVNSKPIDNGGGRGGQILTGINASGSDIVAIVHSDVIIHSAVFTKLKNFLATNPDAAGGAVGTKFAPPSLKTGFIELLNGIRVLFFGISFGDQIQFFRRQAVIENDLFPDIPLMEDIEFSLRLPKVGRSVFLFGDATVSSRRWETKGAANFFMVLRLFVAYLFQRLFKAPDTIGMYRTYY